MSEHAQFTVTRETFGKLVITDTGDHTESLTVTNDVEYVVEELHRTLKLRAGQRLFYYDSGGDFAEIAHEGGKFKGFRYAKREDHDQPRPTEAQYRDEAYARAKAVKTTDQLVEFIGILTNYDHDYGTIVYACAAAMDAAFRVVNESPQGGITGFQAGCLMWEMVHRFGHFSRGPLRILDFDHLRFPQFDEEFALTLSKEGADELMGRAEGEIVMSGAHMHPSVRERNEQIAKGQFPAFVKVEGR